MLDLNPIIQAVQLAITLTRRVAVQDIAPAQKTDHSPVTLADYGAQALICRAIATHFPGDAIIAEENGTAFIDLVPAAERARVVALLQTLLGERIREADVVRWLDHGRHLPSDNRTWVIDPIDGTVGYVNGRYYAICVAAMEDYQPRHAVLGLPRSPLDATGTVLHTTPDGVTAMAADGGHIRQVGVSDRRDGAALRVLDSIKLPPTDLDVNAAIRERAGVRSSQLELYDSQLKYGMIAAGYGDLFVRLPRDTTTEPHYIWDHATGTALLRAAGGVHTDLRGQPLDYSQGAALPHYGFVASNGHLHAAVIEAVAAVLGPTWGFLVDEGESGAIDS